MSRYVFKLPDVGEGTTEAEIAKWHVAVGDRVAEDQPLVDVTTDKANVEIPAPVAGTVLSISGKPGEMVAVGSELVVMETDDAAAIGAATDTAAPTASVVAAAPASKQTTLATPSSALASTAPRLARPAGERASASPAVRKRARELGLDLQQIAGTGEGGRITHADLDALAARSGTARDASRPAAPTPAAASVTPIRQKSPDGSKIEAGIEEIRITGIRRTIAERMQEAKRRIPHFSYIEEVDMTALEALRRHLNGKYEGQRPKLTLLPFLVTALAKAMPSFPEMNARFDDDQGIVRRHAAVHVGIATQAPNGLMVPVLRDAGSRDLWDCAAEIARLARVAREGKATREELTGSTITITSLGALGGLATTPVINYPEVAIVGVNKIAERPVVRDGQIVARTMMNLSSSFDHRVIDGWNAARFVQALRELLELPATLFIP